MKPGVFVRRMKCDAEIQNMLLFRFFTRDRGNTAASAVLLFVNHVCRVWFSLLCFAWPTGAPLGYACSLFTDEVCPWRPTDSRWVPVGVLDYRSIDAGDHRRVLHCQGKAKFHPVAWTHGATVGKKWLHRSTLSPGKAILVTVRLSPCSCLTPLRLSPSRCSCCTSLS